MSKFAGATRSDTARPESDRVTLGDHRREEKDVQKEKISNLTTIL